MMELPTEVDDLPHLDERKKENWVSTLNVLSMRPYAHTQAKHVKKDF